MATRGAGSVKYSARGTTAGATLERRDGEETGEFSCIMVPQNTGHAADREREARKETGRKARLESG